MIKQIEKFFIKITPAIDKLRHDFWFNYLYVILLPFTFILNINAFWASLTVLLASILVEYIQKAKGGSNTSKEQLWDIFHSNIKHILISGIITFLTIN